MSARDSQYAGHVIYLKKIFVNQNFALLWGGQTISMLGDVTFSTAIVLWIAVQIAQNQSWAPLAVSGALFANYGPAFLLGPIAGVFVDRWNKRRTMLIVDILRAGIICLFLGIITTLSFFTKDSMESILLIPVYLITFVISAGDRLFNPAMLALLGDILEEDKREHAAGLNQISQSLATIIGPPLATLLFFSVGIQWLLLINALSFVVSFFSIYAIRHQYPQPVDSEAKKRTRGVLQELYSGLGYSIRNRLLLTLFLATAISMLGAGALNALDIFFLVQNLHTAQNLYGVLDMFFGIGLVIGAVLSAIYVARIGKMRVFWSAQVLIGILIIIYSRMTTFLPAVLVLFFIGWPLAALTVVSGPFLLRIVAREFLGRVVSILDVLSSLGMLVGASVAGVLASAVLYHFHTTLLGISFTSIDTVMLGAGTLMVLSGFFTLASFHGMKLEKKPAQDEQDDLSISKHEILYPVE